MVSTISQSVVWLELPISHQLTSYSKFRYALRKNNMKKVSKRDIELTQEEKDFQAEQRRIIKENLEDWQKNPPKRRHRK